MIVFAQELLCEVVQEVQPLLQAHYDELTLDKSVMQLAPKWRQYAALEQSGFFVVATARADGVLVGYSGFMVINHMHYERNIVAVNDVLFLRRDWRQGSTGIKFIKFCEKLCAERGAQKITWGAKTNTGLIKILGRLGYREEDVIMSKTI